MNPPTSESGAGFLSLDSSSGSFFQMFRLHIIRSASTPGAKSATGFGSTFKDGASFYG